MSKINFLTFLVCPKSLPISQFSANFSLENLIFTVLVLSLLLVGVFFETGSENQRKIHIEWVEFSTQDVTKGFKNELKGHGILLPSEYGRNIVQTPKSTSEMILVVLFQLYKFILWGTNYALFTKIPLDPPPKKTLNQF